MKKLLILFTLLVLAPAAIARDSQDSPRHFKHTSGYYLLIGGTSRPSFSSFFDYVNNVYQPLQKHKGFGGNISLSLGYISRFQRHFALDLGFTLYDLRTVAKFQNQNNTITESTIREELHYQAAVITGTIPYYFEYSQGQTIIPYAGIGFSVFSMRLDHYRDSYSDGTTLFSDNMQDTRMAVGGHLEAGFNIKLSRQIMLDFRGRWHSGLGHLSTLEDGFKDFSIKQDVSQISVGINYFLR
jgi:opacity protein-like surface antigen